MTPTGTRRGEAGSILVVSLIAAILMVGFTYAFLIVSRGEIEGAKADARNEKALQAAEAGIEEVIDRLNSGDLSGVDRSGDPVLGYRVGATDSGATSIGNRLFTLTSRGSFAGANRAVEVVVENQTLAVRARAAITSDGPVLLTGNVLVDGRDHDADGFGTVGPGVFGVVTSQTVLAVGNAHVGGNGQVPLRHPSGEDAVFRERVGFGDGIDQDGDGRTDEERYDGLDDDGDGLIDEDLAPYPSSPDELFGLPDGTLKRVARNQGTYFSDPSDFEAFLSANGNEVPGGRIIVLDYACSPILGPVWNPVEFGPTYNEEPSILVFHSPYSNAVMKNLHGRFKGILLTDTISHVNGDARILGAIYTFGQDRFGSNYGTGNAEILYSSGVLSRLPLVPYFAPRAWREVAAGE
jgi:hypothetical protein